MSGTRIARGIFRDGYGYEIRWRERGKTRTKRLPLDAELDALKAYRDTKERIRTSQQKVAEGSFARDVRNFLARRKGLASYAADRSHLRCWLARFRHLSRFSVTREAIAAQLGAWRLRYSPRELRHRWRILGQFFSTLDPDEPNPCTGIKLPAIPKARPRSVSDRTIRSVADNLRTSELKGRLRDAKTRGRFLVLATTGQRPAQLKRTKPGDVDLERRIWFVEPAKGDNGTTVYLNDEMLAAWQVFISAAAWGAYNTRSFTKTLQRNGWPPGVRPYVMRHSVGLSLSEHGVDLGDIQAHLGHTSPNTTRIYVPTVLARLRVASAVLEGRLLHATPTPTSEEKQNVIENTECFSTAPAPRRSKAKSKRARKVA
jgi:site-specific recombinase XerD